MYGYILRLDQIRKEDLAQVGGKNASLGEMYHHLSGKGIKIPAGFATTARAYWHFLDHNSLRPQIQAILAQLDLEKFSNLAATGHQLRQLMLHATIPPELEQDLKQAYRQLCDSHNQVAVAVRSSATAEDLPQASFAGQLESFLNVSGEEELLYTFQRCLASLFTDRVIKYRSDYGFDHLKVALSVGVQLMVRSDRGCSGVAFTLDPDTGFRDLIVINGIWGLGENIVQGRVKPDEYLIFKPMLMAGKNALIARKVGEKELTMVYDHKGETGARVKNKLTPPALRHRFVLSEEEALELAQSCLKIEQHYHRPMDIEWARDGLTGEIYIVQARPETVHASQQSYQLDSYHLKQAGEVIVEGLALGQQIASGRARILQSPEEADKLKEGDVLVTGITSPDWDPIMKKAAAIITDQGGRTSHAAIVARELGVVAVVGCRDATQKIKDGELLTVSCAEGKTAKVYRGKLPWTVDRLDLRDFSMPRTQVMLILGDPDKAFKYSFLPNNGIGLLRLEFIINNSVKVHPLALLRYDELQDENLKREIALITQNHSNMTDYFVDSLAQGVATIAAAFYPKEVIVRMSDFKSNEYAHLLGGRQFEPEEENPMLGFRGASRYYHELYREGFRLECEAMKKLRNEMGLTNVKLMIPFCRSVAEGKQVLKQMATFGLKQGEAGLEIYTMVEIPSNVILAREFAQIFDGFSIGSNDLTQLTLGLDRDSSLVSNLFDERDAAVQWLISTVIKAAHDTKIKIGLCGQAPSDFPEYAEFLVKEGIDSISFNPDALLQGIANIKKAEEQQAATASDRKAPSTT